MTQSKWPSLKEQLAEAKAPRGSALEKLIRDNQQFDQLRPEEAQDNLGVPPWLRVYWRKGHPEGVYSAHDPTGGYPRVLKNIHRWMLAHPDLKPGPPANPGAVAAPAPPAAPAPAAPKALPVPTAPKARLAVGANLRISGAQSTPRSESDIRVNYNSPTKITAASNAVGPSTQAQFNSSDGGATWSQTSLPLGGDSFQSDPTVDWTSDGTAWASTIGVEVSQTTPALQLRSFKSADGGATWAFDATVSSAQTAADKELMWVDHRPTSPFKDNIYVIWHNNQPVFVARRTAAGWQPPLRVSGAETTGTGIGGDIKTNSDGDVFAFWPDTGSRTLLVAKSTDGGASFAQPVTITTTYGAFTIGVPSFASRKALIYPSGGAFRTAAKNLVYAAWADLSGESGCTTPGDAPGTNVDSACKTRIWFSRSTDGGATWEVPRMINNQRSLNDQFNPRLAVDETTGRLVVVYYDTVGDSGRLKTDVWTQSSSDDGVTWSAPVKVTTAETDETAAGADSGNQYGDYIGLSGYAGIFFPSWTDRRSGGPEEIWTAPIRFPLDKVVQLWGNGNQLAMKVYGSDGSSGYKLIWKNDNMGQGAGAIAWLVGDLDGDGKAKIVQLWNDHNHLAMFFYGSDGSGGYKLTSDLYTQEVPRAVAWLVGDLDGDGKAKIVQLWDKGNRLAMNVYGSDGSGGYKRTWQSSDMGQGPGAVAWLVGDLDGDGKAKIIQLWNDHNNLQMVFYGSDGSGGYTQTFALNTGQGPGAVAWLAPWSWR